MAARAAEPILHSEGVRSVGTQTGELREAESCPCCGQVRQPRGATDDTRDSGLVRMPEDVRAEIKAILERKDRQGAGTRTAG